MGRWVGGNMALLGDGMLLHDGLCGSDLRGSCDGGNGGGGSRPATLKFVTGMTGD